MTVLETIPKQSEILAPLMLPREAWSEADEALFGPQDLFRVETDEAEELRLHAIQQSLRYHSERNGLYRALCKDRGFRAEDVRTIEDLAKVPLIPDSIFKGCQGPSDFLEWLQRLGPDDLEYPMVRDHSSFDSIMEELNEKGFTVTYSSGTSGRFTFVPRDELTWKRACYALSAEPFHLTPGLVKILSSPKDRNIILLGPDPKRTFIFLGRACSMLFSLFPGANFYATINRKLTTDMLRISQGNTRGMKEKLLASFMKRMSKGESVRMNKRVIDMIVQCAKEGKGGVLSGAPHWMYRIASEIEQTMGSLNLGDKWAITSGGGWKMMEYIRVPAKDFRAHMSRILGIPDENIRDMYGMTECNAIFPECEGHYKHIPSTLVHPLILDDEFNPLPYGKTGRFAFIDPLARSYPGCVITGDRARILEHCPACDRPGQVLDPEIRRMPGVGDRGCANVVTSYMQAEAQKP